MIVPFLLCFFLSSCFRNSMMEEEEQCLPTSLAVFTSDHTLITVGLAEIPSTPMITETLSHAFLPLQFVRFTGNWAGLRRMFPEPGPNSLPSIMRSFSKLILKSSHNFFSSFFRKIFSLFSLKNNYFF